MKLFLFVILPTQTQGDNSLAYLTSFLLKSKLCNSATDTLSTVTWHSKVLRKIYDSYFCLNTTDMGPDIRTLTSLSNCPWKLSYNFKHTNVSYRYKPWTSFSHNIDFKTLIHDEIKCWINAKCLVEKCSFPKRRSPGHTEQFYPLLLWMSNAVSYSEQWILIRPTKACIQNDKEDIWP